MAVKNDSHFFNHYFEYLQREPVTKMAETLVVSQ